MTADYASFQLWDTSQALCSYVRGMLCHKAMLAGIGVGKEVRRKTFKGAAGKTLSSGGSLPDAWKGWT